MLLDYASRYNDWIEHDSGFNQTYEHSGKAFAQSLDEASWATHIAQAYVAIKPTLTAKECESIEQGYLIPASKLLMARNGGGNWQMWHNSGLAALGIALEDDSIIDVALNRKGYGYHHMVKTMKNPDGWINEGSPHYHYYPLEALIATARAVRCRGLNLFNADLHDMFAEPIKGVYPDLSFAAHSDGWYGANLMSQSNLYELAALSFPDPMFLQLLEKSYSKKRRLDPEALMSARTITPDSSPLMLKSHVYEKSGFGVLRYGKCSLVFKFGGEGIGHGHPDKLSFTLHNGSKELISDFGTSGYGTPDYLGWYKCTLSHNTVTVDHGNQQKSTGRLVKFATRGDGGYIEGVTTKAYPGVTMRRTMSLNEYMVRDTFDCKSEMNHTYDYVLIFNEKPNLNLDGGDSIMLDKSEAEKRLMNALSYNGQKEIVCRTSDLDVCLNIQEGTLVKVILAESPGIPANPTVKDGPGAAIREASTCFPLILRISGKDMTVTADYFIKQISK